MIRGKNYTYVIVDELDNLPKTLDTYKQMFDNDTLNHSIFQLTAPYDNPYQGNRKRILFVCSAGLLRSPTGAHVGSTRGYNTRAAGSAQRYALIPITANLIEWAQKIVFVNRENYLHVLETFKSTGYEEDILRKGAVLDIPDKYPAFDPVLIKYFNDWFDEYEKEA